MILIRLLTMRTAFSRIWAWWKATSSDSDDADSDPIPQGFEQLSE